MEKEKFDQALEAVYQEARLLVPRYGLNKTWEINTYQSGRIVRYFIDRDRGPELLTAEDISFTGSQNRVRFLQNPQMLVLNDFDKDVEAGEEIEVTNAAVFSSKDSVLGMVLGTENSRYYDGNTLTFRLGFIPNSLHLSRRLSAVDILSTLIHRNYPSLPQVDMVSPLQGTRIDIRSTATKFMPGIQDRSKEVNWVTSPEGREALRGVVETTLTEMRWYNYYSKLTQAPRNIASVGPDQIRVGVS